MKSLRVAVTGGSGRIGSQVVKQLVERGHKVLNLDRREATEPRARFIFVDLRQREQIQPIFENVDAVAHLGEIPGIWGHTPEEVLSHNVTVGSVVLQTAADLKIPRVIYTSTCQTYGFWTYPQVAPLRLPFDETHPLQPQNAYSLSKAVNENFAQLVSKYQGLSVAIFRFPAVYPWDKMAEDYNWAQLEKRTGKIDGFQTYVHVDDAARAYVLALENPRPGCEAYHFTADEVEILSPLRERLIRDHPHFPQLPADWPPFKSPVSTAKALAHFGWAPTWNLLDVYRKKFGRAP